MAIGHDEILKKLINTQRPATYLHHPAAAKEGPLKIEITTQKLRNIPGALSRSMYRSHA